MDGINQHAAPLIEILAEPLREHAERLVRTTWHALGVDGYDLAQDAWIRVLQYLASPEGEGIVTVQHFQNLLWLILRQRFLDAVDRARGRDETELDAPQGPFGEAMVEQVAQRQRRPGEGILWLEAGHRAELVYALFQDEEAFIALCRGKPSRRLKQYRACVLMALAECYQWEVGEGDVEGACALFSRYVALLGVPQADWEAVQQVACRPGVERSAVLAVVNARCGTQLRGNAILSVLRYELNQLAGG